MCSQVQFQERRTKLWLFDPLVASVMLYGVQIQGPLLAHCNNVGSTEIWRCMERPVVSMISGMIRAKGSILQEIIRAEMAAPLLWLRHFPGQSLIFTDPQT